MIAAGGTCFAKAGIDDVLAQAGQDVSGTAVRGQVVAVLDFDADGGTMGSYISDVLSSQLIQGGNVQVVTRQNMDMVERELDFQLSGLVSDSTMLSVGERLGAKAIVFGRLEELDNNYLLQVRVLDVEHAAYIFSKSYTVSRSSKTEQLLGRAALVYKTSLGLLAEVNKNSLDYVAPAAGISFDYSFFRRFSAGVKVLASWDVMEKDNSVYAIEPLLAMRYYTASPTGEPSAGLFFEGLGGASLLMVNSKARVVPSIGVAAGFRFVRGSFFFEPTMRFGSPYLFGAGMNAGFRL